MRTVIEMYCPFGRDVAWITQEMIEEYAGASITGKRAAEKAALDLAGNDYPRSETLRSMLDTHPLFAILKEELLDEYGLEHFVKPKSMLEHIRDLEERMEAEPNNDTYAKLNKELRELRGWVVKPAEKTAAVTNVNVIASQQMSIDRSNPKELERYYHSIMG